jgi:hypothetical protein
MVYLEYVLLCFMVFSDIMLKLLHYTGMHYIDHLRGAWGRKRNVGTEGNQSHLPMMVDGRFGSLLRGYHPVAPRPISCRRFVHHLLVPPVISAGAPRQAKWETSVSEGRNDGREMASQFGLRFQCPRKSQGSLTHCGPVTQICVFALQLWKMDDAKLPFNTRLVFTHLITQYLENFLIWSSGPDLKKKVTLLWINDLW